MLETPAGFIPLLTPQASSDPLNFLFQGPNLLVRESDLALPETALLDSLGVDPGALHPVGLLGGRYCQTAWVRPDAVPAPGYVFRNMRPLFGAIDDALLGVAGRACQIAEWARTHRFCGACAAPMQLMTGERCFRCGACGHMAYPRISPAMIVLIRRGDSVLLAWHTASPTKRFSPLAGFLEAGESIEEAVHREVREEVGLRVHNLKYFTSQSWPFPHSLMVAFTADYLDGEIRVDESEIVEARWFGPDDEWPDPAWISISSVLVNAHRPPGR